MINKETLYTVTMNIGEYENVNIDITYSGEDHEDGTSTLEFEFAEASPNNKFTEEQFEDVAGLLHCGYEQDVVDYLAEYYKGSTTKFKAWYNEEAPEWLNDPFL